MGRVAQCLDYLFGHSVGVDRAGYSDRERWQQRPTSVILEGALAPVADREHGGPVSQGIASISPNPEGTFINMTASPTGFSIQALLNLIVQGAILYETDQLELEAGTPVLTPLAQVGSVGGKPLYAGIALGTDRNLTVSNGS